MPSSRSTKFLLSLFLFVISIPLRRRQEKILGELSEKDSYIADLEMDRHNSGAANRAMIIERLNNEKQQLHNQLKELVRSLITVLQLFSELFQTEIRTKIIQDHLAAKEEYEQREKSLASSSVGV